MEISASATTARANLSKLVEQEKAGAEKIFPKSSKKLCRPDRRQSHRLLSPTGT